MRDAVQSANLVENDTLPTLAEPLSRFGVPEETAARVLASLRAAPLSKHLVRVRGVILLNYGRPLVDPELATSGGW